MSTERIGSVCVPYNKHKQRRLYFFNSDTTAYGPRCKVWSPYFHFDSSGIFWELGFERRKRLEGVASSRKSSKENLKDGNKTVKTFALVPQLNIHTFSARVCENALARSGKTMHYSCRYLGRSWKKM